MKKPEDLDNIPTILNGPISQKAFETAEFSAMREKQQVAYQESLIHYSDMKNIIDTVVEDAMEIAYNQVAEKSILKGLDNEFIAEITD